MNDYFYSKIADTDTHLPGKWACHGIVDPKSKDFYLDYNTLHDPRGRDFDTGVRCEVKIVRGFRGNTVERLD